MQRMREQAASGVINRKACLVAGGLDTQNSHKIQLPQSRISIASLHRPPSNDIIFRLTDSDHGKDRPDMPSVRVRENEPFEVALRRFKRTIEKTGLLTELRAREFYEKPTAERKRKLAAAVKRHYKRLRSQQLPPKLY